MERAGILNKKSFDNLPHCMKNSILNPPSQQKDANEKETRNPYFE